MTITDQTKILNRKLMQNEPQYDLDRKAAKISALSSNNLDKYEYLTGEDLDLKPSQKAKDLMDEIEDADNDIDKYKLAFIGSNREKFNFHILGCH